MRLICPHIAKLSHINHGFFMRNGGESTGIYRSLNVGYGSGDEARNVTANRQMICDTLGVSESALCTLYQIHSNKAVLVTTPWTWDQAPQADALVTRTPGIALGILTADCLPILLADANNRVIGAAHAGWKGAFGGVIEATIQLMVEQGASIGSITASIGPAIAQNSYEVGAEFHARFAAESSENNLYFLPSSREGHYLFDLKGYAKDRLRNAGITDINLLAHDTCLQEDMFFSYRRSTLRGDPAYGRQLSAILLEE